MATLNYDSEGQFFYIPREDCGSVPVRLAEGWIGSGIRTLPRRVQTAVDKGFLVTRDVFLAALYISNASPQAKAMLVDSTKWSWAAAGGSPVPLPFGESLMPFQQVGVCEIARILESQRGVLLGDDMGLGKTCQIIAYLNKNTLLQSCLIVGPATLRLNWAREFAKFSTRSDLKVWQMEKWIEAGCPPRCVVITNYERLGPPELRERKKTPEEAARIEEIKAARKATSDPEVLAALNESRKAIDKQILARNKIAKSKKRKRVEWCRKELVDFKWDLVACDEAHALKESTSQRSKAIFGLLRQAQPEAKVIFATGTPVTKDPMDAQMMLEIIDPERWKYPRFEASYCQFNDYGQVAKGKFKNLDVLNARLRSTCMIRRLKDHVLKDLPAKVRRLIPVEVKHSKEADAVLGTMIVAESDQASLDWDAISGGRPIFDREARAAAQRRVNAAFENLAKVRIEVGKAKLPHVVELTKAFLEENPDEKVIVFAHHREIVAALDTALASYGVVKVVGGLSVEQKQSAVDQFQAKDGPRVFIGNFQAAGVGITLTRSSRVVCAEFDWTPAIMEQAEDRSRRHGQTSVVFVDILFAEGTIDSILVGILNRKREIARLMLDGGRGNGEDVLPVEQFEAPIARLRQLSQGQYSNRILELFDSNRGSLTRNHLSLILATLEGEKR